MQLTSSTRKPRTPSIAAGLALATGALLGHSVNAEDGDWLVSGGVLIYNEGDGRVQAVEPVVNLHKTYGDDSTVDIKLLADTLTGASPNGAARANKVQTFTSASSIGKVAESDSRIDREDDEEPEFYHIAPGDLPSDPSFKDLRLYVGGNRSVPLARDYSFTYGGGYSYETDFSSISVNSALAKDFNQKNTTVSAGVNVEFDNVTPYAGIPVELSSHFNGATSAGSETKTVIDGMLGVTQVLSRRWLAQLSLSVSSASGYLSDPYKILTVADNGNLMVDPLSDNQYLYLFESRPRKRLKSSVFLQNKIAVYRDQALDFSYRYMNDDWGIVSHTFGARIHWQLSEHYYLEPHYRFYQQTAADFYKPYLTNGEDAAVVSAGVTAMVDYASSDPRLAAFAANTLGMKWAYTRGQDQEISLRVEFYQQHDKNSTRELPVGSDLYGFDKFAPLSAAWMQLGYSLKW